MLAFATAANSAPANSAEIGLRPHEYAPTDHFARCIEAVNRSKGVLNFHEIKLLDPYELWLKERERAFGDSALFNPRIIFEFSIEGEDYEDYVIVATNLAGGRSYIADPRVPCHRLRFRSEEEKRILSEWMRLLYSEQLDEPLAAQLFLAIPYLHGLLAGFDTAEKKAEGYRMMAGFLGDFLSIDNMVDFVFDTAFRHSDATTRENCLLGILSAFASLDWSQGAKERLEDEVDRRIAELDDVKVKGNAWHAETRRLLELREKLHSEP
jgi:hypothetical protein